MKTGIQRNACEWRTAVVVAFPLVTLAWVATLPPIPQDPAYHDFADTRSFAGVPNFLNVSSNIPFLLIGLLGMRVAANQRTGPLRAAWLTLFAGVTLVSAGSGCYHWAPDDASLLWDRLPMTLGFMGLLAALIGEYMDARIGRRLLSVAVAAGAGSLLYWHLTRDLRFYAWIQFMPLGVLTVLLVLYKAPFSHSWLLILALGFYGLAKVSEYFDAIVFEALGESVSGHTIKHLLSASACLALVSLLKQRRHRALGDMAERNTH